MIQAEGSPMPYDKLQIPSIAAAAVLLLSAIILLMVVAGVVVLVTLAVVW